jgi:hypothetical protein
MEPPKAEQPPIPVRKAKRHRKTTGIDPWPLSYATIIRAA